MQIFPFTTCIITATLLMKASAKLYVQIKLDRPRSIIGKIFGDDNYAKPGWRLYSCFKDGAEVSSNRSSLTFCKQISGVTCKRLKLRFPRPWRRWKLYKRVSFFETHRASVDGVLRLPDTAPERVPAELWLGVVHADDCPPTPLDPSAEMRDLVKNRSDAWIATVRTPGAQENLRAYLAAPGLAWRARADLKTAYLRAYVAYLTKVIRDYDKFMLHRTEIHNDRAHSVPLDWRGPAWLDWKGLKSAKSFYNKYWKGWDQMHRMWLWNPTMESRLRKMIPVLAGKMIDPCLLGPTIDPHDGFKTRSYLVWDPFHSLCAIYCRFQQTINFLYPASHSIICATVGINYNQGRCQEDQCLCFARGKQAPHPEIGFPIPLRYCINRFNLRRYNETHPMN